MKQIRTILTYTFVLLFAAAALTLPSCSSSDGDRLFKAAEKGDVATVKALLAKGVDPDSRYMQHQASTQPYETPIIAAAEYNNLEVVKALVEGGADLETRNTDTSQTALWKAVYNQRRKIVEYLLAKGADPKTQESMGKSVLMVAIEQDDLNMIKLLVKYGAWPDPTARYAGEVAGSVGLDAIGMAKALKRPYVGYLQQVLAECRVMLKVKMNCKRI